MHEKTYTTEFSGPLKSLMENFLREKRAIGYRYTTEARMLKNFDLFLIQHGHDGLSLPKILVEQWTNKKPNESICRHRDRISLIRQFCRYLNLQRIQAYVPDPHLAPMSKLDFVPRIFTRDEVKRLLETADSFQPNARVPLRHIILPIIFRLLYGCGLRLGEVLQLRVKDVDIENGILTIRRGKFRKDRLVPIAVSLKNRMQKYFLSHLSTAKAEDIFFPAPDGGPYSKPAIRYNFHQLLSKSNIPYAGKGKGPRLHDIRHTFAVHRLNNWYQQGVDMSVALPLLATYMGHENMIGTQRYLHLTAEVYPDLSARLNEYFGHIIPIRRLP